MCKKNNKICFSYNKKNFFTHVQVNLKYSIEFNQTSTIKCSNQNYVLKSIEFWY